MPGLEVQVARHADDLAAWPDGPAFYGLPWLRFYERAVAATPRYVCVTRAGEPVASAICALDGYLYIPMRGRAREFVRRVFAPRVLMCEVPAMEQPGIWLDPAHAREAAPALAEALWALARAERRALVLIPYLDEALHASRAAWRGYLAGQSPEDDTCIALSGGRLEDFIAGLPGPKARKRLRQLPGRLEHAGMSVAQVPAGDPQTRGLFALVQAVHRHHGEPGSLWQPEAFDALACLPYASVTVVRAGDRPVACEALLVDREDATMKLFGMDYGASYRDFDTLTTFSHLPEVLALGVRRFWMGTTRVEKKVSHFGATRIPRYRWVRGIASYGWLLRAAGFRAG